MTPHLLAYPLVLIALMQLGPLVRREQRWHRVQILQWLVVLVAAAGAFGTRRPTSWLALGWGVFSLCFLLPRLLVAGANQWRLRGRWRGAGDMQEAAGWLVGGGPGRVYRAQARAWRAAARHDLAAALFALDDLANQPLPAEARGAVLVGRLGLLVDHRYWERARARYLSGPDWGSVGAATQARLLAARVHAELGDSATALRCLQFVALSPVITRFERSFWTTRVRVAALAGDTEELERLLAQPGVSRRGFVRFSTYWRGRGALAAGDRGTALRLLARAHALTHPRDTAWTSAVRHYLRRAEEGPAAPAPPRDDAYRVGLELLHLAEQQSTPWRSLMQFGRPGPVTAGLLLVIGLVFLAQTALPARYADGLLTLAGNGTFTIRLHQWWRLVTAMFLHGGGVHFAMNGLALWLFGSAVERAWGWWRLLVIFLVTGTVGNLLSALIERYDIAIGASGAIFGLLGAYAVAIWRLDGPAYASLRQQLLGTLALLVSADFFIGAIEPRIDNLAHVGGFVAGLPLALLLAPPRQKLGQHPPPPAIISPS